MRHELTRPTSVLLLISAYCQAHVWDLAWTIPVYTAATLLCLLRQGTGRHVGATLQTAVLVAAFASFGLIRETPLRTVHQSIFLGSNVLYVYQLLHTMAPPSLRARQWCVFSSLILIGMGTQVVVNVTAIPVLLVTLILLPKALAQLESERLDASRVYLTPTYRLGKRGSLVVIVLVSLFWLFFPRVGSIHSSALAGAGGALHDQIDMSDSVSDQGSDRMIFRIEGENLGYLKTKALDVFDGQVWSISRWNRVKMRNWEEPPAGAVKREIMVADRKALGVDIPTDGHVHVVWGSTLERGVLTRDGAVHFASIGRREATYYYWTSLKVPRSELPEREWTRNRIAPIASPQLQQWLADTLGDEREPEAQIEILRQRFQQEFRYQTGVPDLDRMAPVDDLIFNQKEGHCERFASAMALLLRLRGIPARVALGYVPSEKNPFGDFYNVRQRHAHAWTEAWYDGQWHIVDATPFGSGIEIEQRQLALTLYEWLQHVWVSKIVEFDVEDQDQALRSVYGFAVASGAAVFAHLPLRTLALAVLALFLLIRLRGGWPLLRFRWTPKRTPRQEAQHFYGDLLRALRKQGITRRPSETPHQLRKRLCQHPAAAHIDQVTDLFCGVVYAGKTLSADDERRAHRAIACVRKADKLNGG